VKRFLDKYVAFVREPDVARLLLVALLSRMPVGMGGFALLMFLRTELGDYARAGAAVGVQLIALAFAAPVMGRLIDRVGGRMPLIVTGTIQPLAMLAVMWATLSHQSYAVILVLAAFSGISRAPRGAIVSTTRRIDAPPSHSTR
jgi:MFS family permease